MPHDVTPAPPRRARSRRAAQNDERLAAAARDLAARAGYDALNPRAIAVEAGLSPRPAYERFPERASAGIAIWSAHAGTAFRHHILGTAHALLSGPDDVDNAIEHVRNLQYADDNLAAATELLGGAVFDQTLRDFLLADLTDDLAPLCGPDLSAPDAARGAYALGCAMGLTAHHHRRTTRAVLDGPVRTTVDGLARRVRSRRLPPQEAEHMRYVPFATGDETLDALLNSAMLEVSEVGYHAATMERICARAGVTQGLIFFRYATKLDMFVDVAERRLREAIQINADYSESIARRRGPGIAEAVFFREVTRPEHDLARHMSIEQLRVSWYEPRLRVRKEAAEAMYQADRVQATPGGNEAEITVEVEWGLSLGHGATLLPILVPHAWTLPMDVATVPILEA